MRNYTHGLVVYIQLGLIKHFGIISGISEFGEVTIISNSKKHMSVTEETLENFSQGHKVLICNHKSKYQARYLINRARQQLGKKYSLFNDNCEHFVRWVHHLKPESPQLQFFTLLAAIGLLAIVLTRR